EIPPVDYLNDCPPKPTQTHSRGLFTLNLAIEMLRRGNVARDSWYKSYGNDLQWFIIQRFLRLISVSRSAVVVH
ncbi:MAG: hypothetical protein OXG88_01090, partial [Gammaproteobacteria bacterium]|nr:hypothetical protein [Gammaproteobacteria bacterium]